MNLDCDITIIGGGLVGSIFALAVAKENLTVQLFDDSERCLDQEFDGRAYALSQSSWRLLSALGISAHLGAEHQAIRKIYLSDGSTSSGASPFTLEFDGAEIESEPMAQMVEERHLKVAVNSAIEHQTDSLRIIKSRICHLETEFATAITVDANENHYRSSVIAGCDGRDSVVAHAAGIRRLVKDYNQTAVVCAVEHELCHDGAAHQFFMEDGPLAILPLPGNRSSLVWTVRAEYGFQLANMTDDEFLTHLQLPFGNFMGGIKLVGKRAMFPLSQSLAEQLIAPRLALLGESAHGLHPLAGQGLNLGLRDAASLAEILGTARRRGEDIGDVSVLERYQTWRRFDIALFATVTDGCNWLFSNNLPILRGMRRSGFLAINNMPAVRRALIREAAGLHGRLPEVMLRGTTR